MMGQLRILKRYEKYILENQLLKKTLKMIKQKIEYLFMKMEGIIFNIYLQSKQYSQCNQSNQKVQYVGNFKEDTFQRQGVLILLENKQINKQSMSMEDVRQIYQNIQRDVFLYIGYINNFQFLITLIEMQQQSVIHVIIIINQIFFLDYQ
ncbi:unnamed protein product [Paramecium pentaurelia]|uniref:Uncharacterized protein n=1 Tax=Paramecium pentaurelia TaxID=43138 RepID=A0A8S1WVB7_9CILI|nr:unnamed protein product [Paramecium pentaurelia]